MTVRAMFEVPRLHLGSGTIATLPEELDRLRIRRPFLVTDRGLVQCGVASKVIQALRGRPVAEFVGVPENPHFAVADQAAEEYRRQGCDAVVAVGGGSVIDVGKFVAVLAGHGGRTADFVAPADRITAATAPIIALPTTAGTGSEASPDAGIHPTPTTRSAGITSTYVVPKVAICDPDLTVSLPPRLTACTGLDALSHCIEGYLSVTDCPLADALALDGVGRAWRFLDAAFRDGSDLEARREMMLAAFAGGVAIGKGLGPAHAIAITVGDQGLQHGLLSALGIVASAAAMHRHVPARVDDIARAMGLGSGAEVATAVRARMATLGLPTSLAAAGYRVGDVGEIARVAQASHFNLTSPHRPSAEEFETMIRSIAERLT